MFNTQPRPQWMGSEYVILNMPLFFKIVLSWRQLALCPFPSYLKAGHKFPFVEVKQISIYKYVSLSSTRKTAFLDITLITWEDSYLHDKPY